MVDHLYLSPHFDDAALSCGGQIATWTAAGQSVLVVTITGGDPLDALSADAAAALTELQGQERAVADVAFSCEEEILTPVEEQIQRELFARPVQ